MAANVIEIAGLDGEPVVLTEPELDDLQSAIVGPLLRADDDGWDEAVLVWNGLAATLPALVAQPASAADVAAAVGFARERGLLLGIKGGGHNIAGSAIAEGGLTLDMSRLRDVSVDADARLVHVGAGCLLGDVDRATQEHGLATVLGFMSEVGVAGLTLGGGLGYLARRFGWTVDNLMEVEIVTADGRIRRAADDEHADLFWGVRGAGANLGVVTRFSFRVHEVGPEVYGGLIAWPFDRADEIFRAYRAITTGAPLELTVFLICFRAPPAPFVPAAYHGERICAMAVCYSGDLDRADEVLAPIRDIGDPVFDLLGQQPYVQLQSYLDATEPKGDHYHWRTDFVTELTDGLLSTVKELAAENPMPRGEVAFLHLGGAISERAEDDGAVGNRDARYACGAIGIWDRDEPQAESFKQWIHDAWSRFHPYSTGGNYINFQTVDEHEERIRATYGANYDRVLAVKRKYDPDNLFRVNRNIAPQTTGH